MKTFQFWQNIFVGLMALISLNSCETLVNDIALPYEEKLVLQSFICPQDTMIEISLTSNQPVIGVINEGEDRYPVLKDAVITLSDGTRTVTAKYQQITYLDYIEIDSTGHYKENFLTKDRYIISTKEMPVVAGATYTIIAKAKGKEVKAQCTVPSQRVSRSAINNSLTIGYDRNNVSYPAVVVRILDFPNTANNYAVGVFYYENLRVLDAQNRFVVIKRFVNSRQEYLTDTGQDGMTLATQALLLNSTNDLNVVSRNAEIYVAVTDNPYYQFNISVDKVRRSGRNPFSEPVLTYTNVENGLGVFAAYQQIRTAVSVIK